MDKAQNARAARRARAGGAREAVGAKRDAPPPALALGRAAPAAARSPRRAGAGRPDISELYTMRVRCADLDSFSATLEMPAGSTVADLKRRVELEHAFRTASCTVFAGGRALADADPLDGPQRESRLFVFLDPSAFREKSYPTVDGAFPFPTTRFGRPPQRPPEEPAAFGGLLPLELRRRLAEQPQLQEWLAGGLPAPPEPAAETASTETFDVSGTRIEFTREEGAALRRLAADGPDFNTTLQVFVACDRDENTTRQCLLSM
jgi:hypothetical protein